MSMPPDRGAPDGAYAAIVDYGLGNLFSIKQACGASGLRARITADPGEIEAASMVILPGVGAFGDAMAALRALDLAGVLRRYPDSGRPLVGICLGMQLLMDRSEEFGAHAGLGLLAGSVQRFPSGGDGALPKVPQIGWNTVRPRGGLGAAHPLAGVPDRSYFYFLHSYYVAPEDNELIRATSSYAGIEYCSAIGDANVFGCQFHPERSGPVGLAVYRNLAGLATAVPADVSRIAGHAR